MKFRTTALSLAALVAALPAPALSGKVELRSADGLMMIEGDLLQYDSSFLTVVTGHGEVRVPTTDMVCLGDPCPSFMAQDMLEDDLTIAFGNLTDRDLMMMLLSAEQVNATTGTEISFSGTEIATIRALESFQTASLRLLQPGETDGSGVTISASIPMIDQPVAYSSAAQWASVEHVSSHMVAARALEVYVAPTAGIDALSPQDVARIFSGEVTNWSELGGNDIAIQPIKVQDGSQAFADLENAINASFGLGIHADVLTVADEATALQVLDFAPGAITVIGQTAVGDHVPVPITNACGQDVTPNAFAINNGSYPLTLTTFASYDGDVETDVMPRVFDAVSRNEMQLVLTNAGYADAAILSAPTASKAARVDPLMAGHLAATLYQDAHAMARILDEATVLSIRLVDGDVSSVIGARNRADFIRLAEAIDQGAFDGHEVLFVGYPTSANGSTAQAETSARQILEAFRQFAPLAADHEDVVLTALGHPVAPVDLCQVAHVTADATVVEVWVRPTR